MIPYKDIRSVHLEISTRCNAACPDCPRNFRGVDVIDTYPILDMKLDQAKQIFTVSFLQQIDHILINGNHGDFITAADGLEIVEYFLETNPQLQIEISTNASGRPKIWQRLGELGITVDFRLDGMRDTHSLYRQNTDWDFIINNAKKFIAAGGQAVWAMIVFDHNKHQVEECRALSIEMGFSHFWIVDNGRDTMPVFTADRRLSHVIGDYRGSTNFNELYTQYNTWKTEPRQGIDNAVDSPRIDCYAKKKREIYIAANGDVYPCCWLGFYPQYSTSRPSNTQLQYMIKDNNALEHGLEKTINWFNQIENSWKHSVTDGRIYACNETCGVKQ